MAGLARLVEPELLDSLPANDPRAQWSRRDLKRINAIMFQARIMARSLAGLGRAPRTLVDLGSGDGSFMLAVAKRLAARWPGVTVTLLDQQSIVSPQTRAGFAALGWECEPVAADVFDYLRVLGRTGADAVTANLFLHHFEPAALKRLLASVAGASRAFVTCEPRRSASALLASKAVIFIGCNSVTRHDAVASVRAGFNGAELSTLWPEGVQWRLREHWSPPFSHSFTAERFDA